MLLALARKVFHRHRYEVTGRSQAIFGPLGLRTVENGSCRCGATAVRFIGTDPYTERPYRFRPAKKPSAP